jgi:integrase
MLDRYAAPVIGGLAVNVITVEHMLKILSPIWDVKTETASRLRGRIELILRYAKALKFRSGENPAACRSGESRGALWTEIDLERGLWTIPAQRMKMKRDHRIPLSGAAIELLRRTPKFDNTDLVFSSPQKVHLARPLSDMTLTACHRRLKLTATVHGWRSTFKDWAAEKTSYANELSEMALAHSISSGVESAYRRGDLFERRRAMMDDWAAFLATQC